MSYPSDVILHRRIGNAELVWTKSTHTIVGTSTLITLNQVMHSRTTMEDELYDSLEWNDLSKCAQSIVLTQGMTCEVCWLESNSCFTHARTLSKCDRSQSDLSELSQVQQAFWVTVGHALCGELGRVITNHSKDRESKLFTSHLISTLPHFTSRWRVCALIQNHALALDTLTWVDVCGFRRTNDCGTDGDDFLVDAARYFKHESTTVNLADAFDRNFDFIIELNHAIHGVRPAFNLPVSTLDISALDCMLSCSRQPHTMNERCDQSANASTTNGCVNWVEITGCTSECCHIIRSRDSHTTQETTSSILDIAFYPTVWSNCDWECSRISTATNRKTFYFISKDSSVLC